MRRAAMGAPAMPACASLHSARKSTRESGRSAPRSNARTTQTSRAAPSNSTSTPAMARGKDRSARGAAWMGEPTRLGIARRSRAWRRMGAIASSTRIASCVLPTHSRLLLRTARILAAMWRRGGAISERSLRYRAWPRFSRRYAAGSVADGKRRSASAPARVHGAPRVAVDGTARHGTVSAQQTPAHSPLLRGFA